MPEGIEIIFQHGWGFQASNWNPWRKHIPEGILIRAADRGYFGDPVIVNTFSTDRRYRILITHSLGLHLSNATLFQQADLLVIVSGFQDFHPEEDKLRHRSQRILKRMQEKFLVAPGEVLRDFYGSCYEGTLSESYEIVAGDSNAGWKPALPGEKLQPINVERLAADLEFLGQDIMGIEPLRSIESVLLLHGEGDKVVSVDKSLSLKHNLPNANFISLKEAGHALPFTHFAWCWQVICGTLSSLSPEGTAACRTR